MGEGTYLSRFVGLRYANPTYRVKPASVFRRLG
ncbi:MAG: hypothetical protein BMS9Abin08_0381 [Gammaproteobacteria bacterium]|nr:MAG: hypothetical protein BMS9Abin08_0381 [Gammaproteobacteria bacterium]